MSTNRPETPTWPSLYDPSVDLLRIPHKEPVQPRGHYLYDADDIFRFTLYWTFVFYLPLSVLAGIFAFVNIAFAPKPRHRHFSAPFDVDDVGQQQYQHRDCLQSFESHPLAPMNTGITASSAASPTSASTFQDAAPGSSSPSGAVFAPKELAGGDRSRRGTSSTDPASASAPAPASGRTPPKVNPHRTRATYALIILLTYLSSGLLGAVVGSAIVGYVLAGLYKSGGFFMSTWIPPLFALTQTLIGILGVYPSIAEII